jgi:hypothetical protein
MLMPPDDRRGPVCPRCEETGIHASVDACLEALRNALHARRGADKARVKRERDERLMQMAPWKETDS